MKAPLAFVRIALLSSIMLAVAGQLQAQDLDAVGDPLCVSNIQTEDTGTGAIRLSWSLPAAIQTAQKILFYAIYRDQRPIYSGTRVKSLYPIAAVPKDHISYTDQAQDGKSYYYAVLSFVDREGVDSNYKNLYYDEELDGPETPPDEDSGMLYAVILPGINASISPAKAIAPQQPDILRQADMPQAASAPRQADVPPAASAPASTASRPIILEEAETRSKERSISPASEKNASSLFSSRSSSRRKATPLFRHIFSEDQTIPAGGDDYLLYEILQRNWMKYRYTEAKAELSAFLAQNRDAGATQRATFYLAEAEYFTGNYDGALKLFLTVQDSFPPLAGKWIDSCIDLY